MPTYEYRCPACATRFDLFQRMSDAPGAACPACGAAAERLLSAGAGFLFKGDGFYITDYRSADYRKKAEADAKKGEGSGSGATTKPEGGASGGPGSKEGGGSGGGASPASNPASSPASNPASGPASSSSSTG